MFQRCQSIFGLASYYRRFVQGSATTAEPLTRLTKKHVHFHWTEEAQAAFDRLKQELINATFLAFPYPVRPCIVDTDASDVGFPVREWYRVTYSLFLEGHEPGPTKLLCNTTRVARRYIGAPAFSTLPAG